MASAISAPAPPGGRFENEQMELKQNSAEDGSNQEGRPSKVREVMESCRRACKSLKPQILRGKLELPRSSDGNASNQDAQSSRRPSKMVETMESCRRKACVWLKQVVQGNATDGQLKKHLWSNYALKALFFSVTIFAASYSIYQNQSTPAAFSLGYKLFRVSITVSIVMDAVLIILLPSWGNALVIISWLNLEAASSLLIASCNPQYALAILAVLFLIVVVAFLEPKLEHALKRFDWRSSTNDGDTKEDTDEENQYLGHLFDLAQGIADCGGLVSAIFGHYMVGPVTAAGFFFFCSISLGLYIMMVITVRAVARPHVLCLAIVLMVLLFITLAVSVPFAHNSGRNPQVVKYSNHRKTLNML